MRIAIMGSGGLGGYFGAKLAQGGADVHFIARGGHLEAMRRDGLRIEGPEPLHLRDVRATDRPAEAGVMDFVLLGVKLWDTEQAIAQMRPMVGPQTAVISFQNGVLKDQALRAAFAKQVMGGVGYVATTIAAPGVILHFTHRDITTHLVDTPGAPDFLGQSLPALEAVETAAVVINAAAGVEPVAMRMMEWARQRERDRIVVVNKIDAQGVNLQALVGQIQPDRAHAAPRLRRIRRHALGAR